MPAGEIARMRNRQLHDALRTFALEAAHLLRCEQHAGAEIEFELDEGGHTRPGTGGGPTLYHYRPLTAKFISQRWNDLCGLPGAEPAAEALVGGAAAYLEHNGMRGGGSYPALQAMLERLWDESTDFGFPEQRFESVYAEVERTLYERRRQATVIVPVHGLIMRGERVDLGDGLELVSGAGTDAPEEAVWGDPGDPHREGDGQPNALLVLRRDIDPEDLLPLDEARSRFRSMLLALRLFKAGGVALAAIAWRRTDDGRWQPFELEASGAVRGHEWILVEGEDRQLVEFAQAIAPERHGGPVAWALRRFELGCGRARDGEALTDFLLALRALVDGGPETGRSSLALRVAVLCAHDGERKRVQRRLELAQTLERDVIDGWADGPEEADEIARCEEAGGTSDGDGEDAATLVEEAERHLRALLRDVLCGYLGEDLRAVADDLLLEQPEPRPPSAEVFQIDAARGSKPATVPDAGDTGELGDPGEPSAPRIGEEASPRVAVRPATGRFKRSPVLVGAELEAIERDAAGVIEVGDARRVTADGQIEGQLDFDDPASFSAPV